MPMKLSDLVVSSFVELGVSAAFSVTGGATMHLNDSAGENGALEVLYMHNEQSCAMAAEGYARIARKPALVIVTAGPGAINAINGVFGAFTDSIPMVVVSGQARKNTQKSYFSLNQLRQLGDQEAPILNMVSEITKKTYEITADMSGDQVVDLVREAYSKSISGRPGPVWIEIPVDVQAFDVSVTNSAITQPKVLPPEPKIDISSLELLLKKILTSKRPVFLLGSGVKISSTESEAIMLAEKFNVPLLTAWSHDVVTSDHPLFFGRPGTIGSRPGNMILQNSDLLVVLGSRLNIRQISYNCDGFAPNAFVVQVDVDSAELNKPFPRIHLGIQSELKNFFSSFQKILDSNQTKFENNSRWISWCTKVKNEFSIKDADYPVKDYVINAYHLIPQIIREAQDDAVLACGDATACIVPFQTAHLKPGMEMFSNSGCASMGYDLPASIGAAFAAPERQVICFAGDGSIMMNLQELQTLKASNLNILVVILDNGGYLSIKQTQSNFFGRFHGSNRDSGITFPDFARVAKSFDLLTLELSPSLWREQLADFMRQNQPRVLVAKLDIEQEFEPRLKSKMIGGVIQTPKLEDMYPHIDSKTLDAIMEAAHSET